MARMAAATAPTQSLKAIMPEHITPRLRRPGPRARAALSHVHRMDGRPRYFISIAADIACVHPRTLRIYEDEGLLRPHRRNRLRLYSDIDLEKVRLIRFLTRQHGVNLAGVRIILQLHERGQINLHQVYPDLDQTEASETDSSIATPTTGASQ